MTESGRRIVVGIDTSPGAKAALAWALDEARRVGATVEVVHAWEFPGVALAPYGSTTVPVVTHDDLAKLAEAEAHEIVVEVAGDEHAVPVITTVEEGHPAEVLLNRAAGADMLVVGSRGRGGFAGMLLGSVSNHVVHHATVPLVVIRPPGG